MSLFSQRRNLDSFDASDVDHRFSALENSVSELTREVKKLRVDLHQRITKAEVEEFLQTSERRIEEAVKSAERLELRKQELGKMIGHLAEIKKKVEYIDPNIREVFLDLNERIRHAEKLIKRLDGKIEKKHNDFLKNL